MSSSVEFLVKGLVIGVSIAAPVGPIGVLTIKRTLSEGRLAGLATGMGAAFADATYGFVAAFGLSSVSGILLGQVMWVRLVGGVFLLYLGIRAFFARPSESAATVRSKGLLSHLVSTFFLTLTNPSTILSFAAIFAGLGLAASPGDYASSALLVSGVFIGSAFWWLFLSWVVSRFRTRVNTKSLVWINRLSGIILVLFGIWALAGL